MLKRYIPFALLVLGISSCYGLTVRATPLDGFTPEEAIRHVSTGTNIQMHGLRTGPAVVRRFALYSGLPYGAQSPRFYAYTRIGQRWWGRWYTKSGGGFVAGTRGRAQDRVEFQVQTLGELPNAYLIVFGHVRSPQVTTVEVLFENKQLLRDTVTNSMFAVVATGTKGVCEVRALDAQDQVIQRISPSLQQHVELGQQDVVRTTCSD